MGKMPPSSLPLLLSLLLTAGRSPGQGLYGPWRQARTVRAMGSGDRHSACKYQLVVDNGDTNPRAATSASQTERPGMNRSTRARGSSWSATGGQSRPRAACQKAVLGSSV
jgi:hypothetical protein